MKGLAPAYTNEKKNCDVLKIYKECTQDGVGDFNTEDLIYVIFATT
jgi:hypothetical protein